MISSGACWLCQLLSFSVPDAFSKTSIRLIFAAGTAMAVVLLFGAAFIRLLVSLKVGQPIREDAGFLLGELFQSHEWDIHYHAISYHWLYYQSPQHGCYDQWCRFLAR